MSIRRYIFIPMIILIIACTTTAFALSWRHFSTGIYEVAHSKVDVAAVSVTRKIQAFEQPARLASIITASNPGLVEAVLTDNHDEILAAAYSTMQLAQTDFCTIIDSSGTVLARTHDPDLYGDTLAYQYGISAALSGRQETTVEPGSAILLSVRSAAPIYDNESNIIGAVSLGYRFDTPEFINSLKETTGCEIFIFLYDECINSTLHFDGGTCAICQSPAAMDIINNALAGEAFAGRVDLSGRDLLARFLPVTGPGGEIVGVIGVGDFWSENNEQLDTFRVTSISIGLIFLLVAAGASSVVTQFIDRKMRNLMRAVHETSKNRDAIMEALYTMIVITTLDTDEIIYMNELMKDNLKLGDNVIGDKCWKHFNKSIDKRCAHCPKNNPELLSGKPYTWEYHNPYVDRDHRITSRILDWPDGRKVMIEQVEDITEAKKAVQEMRQVSEIKQTLTILGSILDGIDALIYVSDTATGELLFVNKRMLEFFGFESEDTVGKYCYNLFRKFDGMCDFCPRHYLDKHPGHTYTWKESFEDIGKTILHSNCYINWPTGKRVLLQYSVDITNMELTQKELEDKNLRLNLLISGMNLGLWDTYVDTSQPGYTKNHVIWSDELRALFGFTDENDFPNVAESWFNRIHPDDIGMVNAAIDAFYSDKTGKTPYNVEYRLMMKTGEYRWFRSFGSYMTDENNNAVRTVGATEDVTSRKNAELEIAEVNRQLKTALHSATMANKAKSAFLANMSHEIRTPMNAILGITEIQLRDENLSPELEENLEIIYESGSLLLNIINDILDLSKIEAGKMEIIPVRYDMPSLINDTVQLVQLRYESKPIEFIIDVDENTPLNIFGDELRIKQILGNILSNAFKYTDEGKVSLNIWTENRGTPAAGEFILVFEVSDTGQGMTAEQLDMLFDEYKRFNMEANRTTIGTGLGMSITKQLVELMGGTISVESEPEKGSLFTVNIPQKRIDEKVCGKELSEKLRTFKFQSSVMKRKRRMIREYMPYGSVLIVDDVVSNTHVARGMLLPYGLKIDSANSGFSAINKIKEGNEYDIIFMDHMMPVMDGIETVKVMRRDYGYVKPIIALTANALVGHAEMFLSNGFDGYISKPIDSRDLNLVLNEFIRDKQAPEVIKAARQEQAMLSSAAEKQNDGSDDLSKKPDELDDELIEMAVYDIRHSVEKLENIDVASIENDDKLLADYRIIVHGMKTALYNIKEKDLSESARRLEFAVKDSSFDIIKDGTEPFISSLKALLAKLQSS